MKVSEAIAALQRELTENGDSDMEVSLESQAPEHISDTIEKNVNYCQERIAHFAVYGNEIIVSFGENGIDGDSLFTTNGRV